MVARAFVLAALVGAAPPAPEDLGQLECKVHLYALQFGLERLARKEFAQHIHDALNLDLICDEAQRAQARELLRVASARVAAGSNFEGGVEFFVSADGDDASSGTEDRPFATLERARDAARAATSGGASGGVVWVRGGKYRLQQTLELTEEDNNLSIRAYQDERVILSGSKSLEGQAWTCADEECKVLKAKVSLPSPAATPISKLQCNNEDDTDLAGNDLATTKADSPAECCQRCSETAGCAAWTIEHKDAKGARCWLKSSASGRRAYADHVSGVLGSHDFGPAPELANQLFVDGVRQVRARFPNANPQHQDGKCFSATQRPGEGCDGWLAPEEVSGKLPGGRVVAKFSVGPSRGDSPTLGCQQCGSYGQFKTTIYDPPEGHPVYSKPLPGQGWKNNSVFSFWGSPFERPAEVKTSALPRNWSRPETGILHMFHRGLWGGWSFRIAGRDGDRLRLGYGGYQEARGASTGKNFHIENVREELDAPQEWFYDDEAGELLLYPNGTATTPDALKATDVGVPLLDALVRIRGKDVAARNITLSGLEFTETRATFMDMYEVPSGGDWSIHRNAALFVENAEGVSVSGCSFNQTGGNALMLSRHVTDSRIEDNEFWQTGDSAVALLGVTDGIDARAATYPNRNRIARNHIREYGVYGKQTSCFFQSLAANTTFEDNVCYNGPRAGINMNDGFGGGNIIRGNLLFNHVRETGDHGPFNSWDRQPYLTRNGVNDGFSDADKLGLQGVSIVKAQCYVEHNFIINGYNGVWAIDHDDGSQFYNDSSNAMFWGGCKNYLGHSKSCDHNLIVYPGIDERAAGSRACQTDDNGVFADQYYHSNNCVTMDGVAYSFKNCKRSNLDVPGGTVYQTANNTFSGPHAFVEDCEGELNLTQWQVLGQDADSRILGQPSPDEIVTMAKEKLAREAYSLLI